MATTLKHKRWRTFTVRGVFTLVNNTRIEEVWSGQATSHVRALRQAAQALWRRPSVRWKHLDSAALMMDPLIPQENKEEHANSSLQRNRSKSGHRRK